MLYELYVENLALIRNLRLCLESGMNAVTGETGAGKSLIIDAVSLLIGGRASDELIRSGENRALIEAVFLPPYPQDLMTICGERIDPEDNIILTREIVRGGRSVARINGQAVTVALLKEVGHQLINIHGQHEHMLLLEDSRQLSFIDSYAGETCFNASALVRSAYSKWQQAICDMQKYHDECSQREQRMEELSYIINSIENVAPQPGEDDALKSEEHLLAHGEQLLRYVSSACDELNSSSGAIDSLNSAAQIIRKAVSVDSSLENLMERLNNLYYEADDIANDLTSYKDGININLYRLDEVANRLNTINRLIKKYGGSIDSTLYTLDEAKKEYAHLEELVFTGEQLERVLKDAEAQYNKCAEMLSQIRIKAAQKLGDAITEQLHFLAMPHALFRVDLIPHEPSSTGNENAQFMICPNVGEPFAPVSKTASGGELSRIILGMKVILAQLDSVPTLIFDEIDTGLSGRALVSVAERLSLVSQFAQTITVSHAPVMAAAANRHIVIEKHEEDGRTITDCHVVEKTDRILELARMIAGDKAGETTMKQAEEMLEQMKI